MAEKRKAAYEAEEAIVRTQIEEKINRTKQDTTLSEDVRNDRVEDLEAVNIPARAKRRVTRRTLVRKINTYVGRLEKLSAQGPEFDYETDQSDTDKSNGIGPPSEVESDSGDGE